MPNSKLFVHKSHGLAVTKEDVNYPVHHEYIS